MPKASQRKNMGPCAICGKDDLEEKFRKLTAKLLPKAVQSEAASRLKIQLKLDDQLCQKHYNELVVFDRNLSSSFKRRKFGSNLAYNVQQMHTEVDSNKQFNIGNCYQDGMDAYNDENRAFEGYLKSFGRRNSDGKLVVGKCYQNGIGLPKDEKKAFEWYMKSASDRNLDGQLYVGNFYRNGIGISKDEKKAFEWYLKSASGGNLDGQLNIGHCYRNGIGIPKDEKKAFEWYMKSASGGNLDGQLNIGHCYQDGIGIPKDEKKAFEWYLKSVNSGNLNGQLYVGDCYRYGIGTFKDEKKASEWYLKSANSRNSDGQLGFYRSSIDPSKKRPFLDIQSIRGQNYRLSAFGKDSEKELSELFIRHQLIMENEQPIFHVHNIQLMNFNQEIINLKYQPFNKKVENSKLDAIVRACDESLLSRDGYRRLAAVEPQLIREHHVAERRIEITDIMNRAINIKTFSLDRQPCIQDETGFDQYETEDGAYRSIRSILTILLPIWKQSTPPVLIPGDTIKLKLGGDGHNVGRKQNHVMMTVCLLNEGKKVLQPNNQYW